MAVGLATLAKVLGKVRRKATVEPITIPYRHGILHGLDQGYDSQLVAAKAWAALLAMGDWARAVQKARTDPPPAPTPGWKDIARQVRENAQEKARLAAWQPRDIQPGRDIPESGAPGTYAQGTAERRLVEFLTAWQARNYGRMAQCLSFRLERNMNRLAGQLREHYEHKRLHAYTLVTVTDTAPAIALIETRLVYDEGGTEREHVMEFRLIHEDAAGRGATPGKVGASWGVMTGHV
jgi:hypothetical protein